jgi:hypothetical protein
MKTTDRKSRFDYTEPIRAKRKGIFLLLGIPVGNLRLHFAIGFTFVRCPARRKKRYSKNNNNGNGENFSHFFEF